MIAEEDKVYIRITLEEYKELLIIKGKYEELKKFHEPITIDWSLFKEDGTTIIPHKEIHTTDPTIAPPYKITCNKEE